MKPLANSVAPFLVEWLAWWSASDNDIKITQEIMFHPPAKNTVIVGYKTRRQLVPGHLGFFNCHVTEIKASMKSSTLIIAALQT
jgi:hypothetical protein